MCGIGAVNHKTEDINVMLYEIMFNLQHRGQDSSGLLSYDTTTNMIHELKEFGLIDRQLKNLSSLKGTMGIGHVRYPTQGIITKNEIQPFYVDDFEGISLVHNGNIVNVEELTLILEKADIKLIGSSDSEIILKLFIYFLKQECYDNNQISNEIIYKTIQKIYNSCKGSYAIILMINEFGLVAFRDIYGIRPLVYSEEESYVAFASETIAFPTDNYTNINNGEVIIVSDNKLTKKQLSYHPHTPCLFEYIYFARAESYINDILVYDFREKIADSLVTNLNKYNIDIDNIDYVVPVPQTGLISAINVGQLIQKPIKYAIIKNRYMHRTFINPDKNTIVKNIKKIKIVKSLIYNKNLLIVDDSIVRGNTSRYIISELKKCGAKKIYLASCCPPIKNPNIYGIAIPSHNELIAYNKTEDEVEKELGVDKLIYLDIDSLCKTLTELNPALEQFETSVFDGNYITES